MANYPARNAFGRLMGSPDALTMAQKLEEVHKMAGGLVSGNPDPLVARWLGTVIMASIRNGQTIDQTLGLVPPQGSRRTPANVVRLAKRDRLLVRFANACGTDVKAIAVINGTEPCPVAAKETLAELLRCGPALTAKNAVSRARKRLALP